MNIDDMEGLDEETRKKIEELQKVTREKDGKKVYARSRFEMGAILLECGDNENAINVWSEIEHLDDPKSYMRLQVNIGIALKNIGNNEKALKLWSDIDRVEDLEAYASAQFYIGALLSENGDNQSAIAIWNNIERTDHLDIYTKGQLYIGHALFEQENYNDAISAWSNIKSSENSELYAEAKLHIGNALDKNNKHDKALIAWNSVNHEDNPKSYANAQLNIGSALNKKNEINKALIAWGNIDYEYSPQAYAQAQFNIGVTSYKGDNKDFALSALQKIGHADNPNVYAKAQYVIAKILKEKNDYEGALKSLCNIERSDDLETYANAELVISSLLDEVGNHTSSLEALSRIEHQDSAIAYSLALWLIGSDFQKKGSIDEAIKKWRGIKLIDAPEIYAFTQYQIGFFLISDHELKEYSDAREAFIKAESYYPYEAYCYKKICDLLLDVKLEAIGEKAWQLLDKTLEIVEILQLDFGQDSNEKTSPERKLAHYTSTDIANLLLERDEEKNLPSAFRLNTINNVNDPSEGQLLINYLKDIKTNSFHAPDFDDKLHAFIGCFTFNHDSLNQFRLYGKQDNKEASGVSLVFQKEFFQSYNSLAGLSFLSLRNEVQNLNDVVSKQSTMDEKTDDKISLSKKPVMRCVYLDPTSDYIHLAQRNRLTFYREFGDEKIKMAVDDVDITWADVEWEKYKVELRNKTRSFEKAFKEIKKIYKELVSEISSLKDTESYILDDIETLSNEILLPLKYLIKHSAFQEEQECRMVYVTSINAPEVIMQHKKLLFVEYKAEVEDNLNKVYIAPAATEYQLYLAWLLRNTNVKIELSNNPYRQI